MSDFNFKNPDDCMAVYLPSLFSSDLTAFEEADRQRWNWKKAMVEKPAEIYGQEIPPILDK